MKLIIAGSRDITDIHHLYNAIDESPFGYLEEIVSGGAQGVDYLGERYARMLNIPIKQFPADWRRYGKRAGMIRNHEMALYADALLAIWDGKSSGTQHMILDMQKTGKPVYVHLVGEQDQT